MLGESENHGEVEDDVAKVGRQGDDVEQHVAQRQKFVLLLLLLLLPLLLLLLLLLLLMRLVVLVMLLGHNNKPPSPIWTTR